MTDTRPAPPSASIGEGVKKDTLVTSIVHYSSSKIYRQFLRVITAFIKPKLLTPELYGLWNILNIIPTYAVYAHLGTRTSVRYLIPYHQGRGEEEKNEVLKSSVFYGSLFMNILVALPVALYALKGGQSMAIRAGLVTVALMVLLKWYYEFYVSMLMAYQDFRLLTASYYLKATLNFALGLILIYFFRIYGVYLYSVIVFFIIIIYFRKKRPLKFKERFDYGTFIQMVRLGVPIMLFGLTVTLVSTSDRIIVSYFLGNKNLGYYSIAIMVLSFFMNIPGTAREVIEPRLMESMALNTREENLNEYLFKPLINAAYFMPFLIGPVLFVFPVLIPLVLPRYQAGVVPTQILILGAYFLALSFLSRGLVVSNNWQLAAAMVSVLALPVNVVLSIILIKMGYGLVGVAIGSSASYFSLFLFLLLFLRERCDYADEDWLATIKAIIWPFPVMILSTLLLNHLYSEGGLNIYVLSVLRLALFYLSMIIMIRIASRRVEHLKNFDLSSVF